MLRSLGQNMEKSKLYIKLKQIIEPLAQSMGLRLWGMDLPAAPKGGVLRVYIDSEDGVSVEQCAELSRNLSVVLDVEDPFPGSYTLEVSSPGLERPFYEFEQLIPYVNQKIAVKLRDDIEGRKNWRGQLIEAKDNELTLEVEGQKVTFNWNDIIKSHLIFEK